eukprot:TRINITY_DN24131_c0_g3_i1.p1 TRINITY_DN24131_c0_g3~~TRINITY_DN24131_c0_g3_i1.p1  ORF type:complete len:1441 (-),score=194.77 TRINITY_DN24131_c0_g3_i1:56-3880(-)
MHPEDDSGARYAENAQELSDNWGVIVRRCSKHAFLGVPPDLTWAIAEASHRSVIKCGDTIVHEGDVGETSGDLLIMDEGSAVVEKMMCASASDSVQMSCVGRLAPGAIIGDCCIAGLPFPRSASVRATKDVELVTVPSRALQEVVSRFPMIMQRLKGRIKDAAQAVQMKLPLRFNIVSSLRLFKGTSAKFLHVIDTVMERKVYYAGRCIQEAGSTAADFHVLELGTCEADVDGQPDITLLKAGDCLADALVGRPAMVNVRVVSPFLLTLTVLRHAAQQVLSQCSLEDSQLLESAILTDSDPGSVVGCDFGPLMMEDIPFFKAEHCNSRFVECLAMTASHRCYLPGQTLVIEGAFDSGEMFWLKGGRAAVESEGLHCSILEIGASFGELMMVGAVRRRDQTIRALSLCHASLISREAFRDVANDESASFFDLEEHAAALSADHLRRTWSVLGDVPSPRLLLRLNLNASRCTGLKGKSVLFACPDDCAAIVACGEVVLVDANGAQLATLPEGSLWNEQALLGLPSTLGSQAVAARSNTDFELLLVKKASWDAAFIGFESCKAQLETRVLRSLGNKLSRQNFDVELDSLSLIQHSSLFRLLSESCCERLSGCMTVAAVQSGEAILARRERRCCFLLDGEVKIDGGTWSVHCGPGRVFGDETMLGLLPCNELVAYATSLCVVLSLSVDAFRDCLDQFPEDNELMNSIFEEAGGHREWTSTLTQKMEEAPNIMPLARRTLKVLFGQAEHVFAKPGHLILKKGSSVGHTPLYFIMSGRATIEGDHGVVFGSVGPGDFFGEGVAFSFVNSCQASVRAYETEALHCLAVCPQALERASLEDTDVREYFEQLYSDRMDKFHVHSTHRDAWLRDVVHPALEGTQLLAGCPKGVIAAIAAPLNEETIRRGHYICRLGDACDATLVLLDGEAEVIARNGEVVGNLVAGSSFGDVNALGLLDTCTATVRATSKCKVLRVSVAALSRGLASGDESGAAEAALKNVVEARRGQALRGLPLGAVPAIAVSKEDLCGRLAALHSEAIMLAEGEIWNPVSNESSYGPCLGFFVKGSAEFIHSGDGRQIARLQVGSMFPEDLLARHGACIRALSNCMCYRIRLLDLRVSMAACAPAKCAWAQRFTMYSCETFDALGVRLQAAEGAHSALRSHPCDSDIADWRARRQRTVNRAQQMRRERLDLPDLATALGPVQHKPQQAPARHAATTSTATAWSRSAAVARGLQNSSSAPNLGRSMRRAGRDGLRRHGPKLAEAALRLPALTPPQATANVGEL